MKLGCMLTALVTTSAAALQRESLQSGEKLYSSSRESHKLKQSNTYSKYTSDLKYGATAELTYDAFIGYTVSLLSFKQQDQKWLAINPMAFAQGYATLSLLLESPYFKLNLFIDLTPL